MSASTGEILTAYIGQDGLGLVEVLVVAIIIGIFCAIALSMYLGQRERAQIAVIRKGGRAIALTVLGCVAASEDDIRQAQTDQASLAAHLPAHAWPASPFTGRPMRPVVLSSDGDLACKPVTADRCRFRACLRSAAPYLVP